MSKREGEWIRVRDFDELFVGCCVRFLCGWCGGIHVGTVLGAPMNCRDPECGCSSETMAETSVICRTARRRASSETDPHLFLSEFSVADGEVDRLRPDAPAASDETSRPARARETVRAGR